MPVTVTITAGMNLDVEVGDHIYTTDHYVKSAFNNAHQILSIYYFAKALEPISVALRETQFHFDEQQMKIYNEVYQIESFRFIDWNDFSADAVTLPLDKIAATIVKENY